MKVTVVVFDNTEAHKANEELTKLRKSVSEFRQDLRDNRVDLDTLESFVKRLRIVANYFEEFMKDEPEEVGQDVPESGIELKEYFEKLLTQEYC